MKKINEIADFLSYFWTEAQENPNLAELLRIEDISLPLAFGIRYGLIESLTERGKNKIVDVYNFLVDVANEQGIELDDLAYTDTPVNPRAMKVTI
jgi:hypothetical protein